MDFTTLTIQFLTLLKSFVGSYGWAIILLTVLVRICLWPLNVSQQRSMRTMQTLQPKMKAIQERYKNNPQVMQQKMMEFYKEHKFNPMGGCMPLLIQMPIFILLYSALMSPLFISNAGDTSFMFIKRLDATLKASVGISESGEMAVSKNDRFMLDKTAKVYFNDGTASDVKVSKPNQALTIQGEVNPGEPVYFRISQYDLNLSPDKLEKVEKAEIRVTDMNTKGAKDAVFEHKGDVMLASVPTMAVQQTMHYDVLLLIIVFGITMFLSQKVMMATSKNAPQDPQQAAIQKSMGTFMPIMIIATFVIIPIPAGVLLYLVTSNIFQIAQTVVVNKQIDVEEANKAEKVDDIDLANAKKVDNKE